MQLFPQSFSRLFLRKQEYSMLTYIIILHTMSENDT